MAERHLVWCEEEAAGCRLDPGTRLGFLLGHTGVLAVRAVMAETAGDTGTAGRCLAQFCRAADSLTDLDPMGVGSDEMLIGRAGYLTGCLWLQARLKRPVLPPD